MQIRYNITSTVFIVDPSMNFLWEKDEIMLHVSFPSKLRISGSKTVFGQNDRKFWPPKLTVNLASVYPFAHRFPKFCHGPCVAMTSESSKKLFDIARTHKWNHMPVEDVLFNGVMRELANITNIELQTGVCRHLTGARSNKLSDLSKYYAELNINGDQKVWKYVL